MAALHSGLVLEVEDASLSNGGNIQVNAWTGKDNQLWKMEHTADGYVTLMNRNSGKVMEVRSGSDSSNTLPVLDQDMAFASFPSIPFITSQIV